MRLTRDELLTAILNDPNATQRERELCAFCEEWDEDLIASEEALKLEVAERQDELDALMCKVERLEGLVAEYQSSMFKSPKQDEKHPRPWGRVGEPLK